MSRPNIDVEIIYSRDQYAWMFGLCIIPISKQMQMYNHILSVSFQARNSGLCLVFIWAWMLGSLIIISAYGRTCWIFWKDVYTRCACKVESSFWSHRTIPASSGSTMSWSSTSTNTTTMDRISSGPGTTSCPDSSTCSLSYSQSCSNVYVLEK